VGVIVAVDGPAGAGKSSVSRLLAERLGFHLLDTGALYRSVALAARRRGVAWDDDAALGALASSLRLEFEGGRVLLDGEDVSAEIRTPEISRGASQVAARPAVRQALLPLQRRLARAAPRGAVLEGRDIGTVVFPDAEVKFFLTASEESRARRRHEELRARGIEVPIERVLADQRERDQEDRERDIAPLGPSPGAEFIDTSGLSLQEVVSLVEQRTREALAFKGFMNLHDVFMSASLQRKFMDLSPVATDPVDFSISDRGRFERAWVTFLYVLVESWRSGKMEPVRRYIAHRTPIDRIEALLRRADADGSLKRMRDLRDYMVHRDRREYWDEGRWAPIGQLAFHEELHSAFSEMFLAVFRSLRPPPESES
jgi:cytidylate kinase